MTNPRAHRGRIRRQKRGSVLFAVMLGITMAILAMSAVLMRADSETSRTISTLRHSQSRAAAWSGVRSALAELVAQRAELLGGGAPELTASWMVVEKGERPGLIARLIDLQPGEGVFAQPEAAKVNANTASLEAMGIHGLLSESQRRNVLDSRVTQPASSIPELAGRLRIDDARTYGRVLAPEGVGNAGGTGARPPAAGPSQAETSAAGSGGALAGADASTSAAPSALLDAFTVFSFDPNVQVGIGGDGSKYAGRPRINLGLGWSDDLAPPIAERFGADAVETTKQLLKGGATFKTMGDVVAVLRRLSVPMRQWGSLLDAFTTSLDPFIAGRVDLLRAGEDVLATVPGIDAAAAGKIVAVRDRLDASARRELTWPIVEGILTEDQFQQAVDSLTNRTLQWRIIVEAGRAGGSSSGGQILDRVVFEAILDVAGPAPRVAYLRDLSAMEAMRAVKGATASEQAESRPEDGTEGLDAAPVPDDAIQDPRDNVVGARLSLAPLSLDTELSLKSDLSLGGPAATAEEGSTVEGAGDSAGAGTTSAADGRGAGGGGVGVDRRIGRWNSPRGEGGRP